MSSYKWDDGGNLVRANQDPLYLKPGDRFFDVANDPMEQSVIKEKNEAWQKLSKAIESMPAEGQSLLKFPE